ncbi:peptidase C69 [Aphanothece hegewaldii CCALA 016]|uniref:Peptidase C69 n=1 Tax=Aphanothece hegewaldii CCALA 016 TaxID=2107694 RepID=A0A2T1LXT9_9CHRO|nr:TldD/PmbA family protein [Aphanothece hegewaldii]PSF37205.1 peptidase C69 [Aphanothece hegewaldii CCALA 016]
MTLEAQQLIDLALKSGASHAEVYQSRSLSRPVFFEANRLKQLESAEAEGTALRLWKDNSPGLAVAYGEVEPKILVEKAIALCDLNPKETIELADARTDIRPNVGESIATEKLVELGKDAINQIRDVYPDVICNAQLDSEVETTLLVNSQGLHCEYTDTSVSYYVGVEWVRGEDFLGVYDGEYTRGKINPHATIQQLLQRLQWAKSNVASPTGKVPVLFTANAATILWGTVASALNGKLVKEKSSPWSDKLGEGVLSDLITLSQQPNLSPYDYPFDDEGTLTQFLSLMEKGTVKQFYCDRTTARSLNTETTGNGFRPSLGRYPTPDLVNLVVEPGMGTLENLIEQIDHGIIIDQILGGEPDLSGDFSINIDLGYRVEKGKITGRVKDTMVAGNVYTALKQVITLGSDRTWNGSCYTPSIIVDGLSVIN